MRIYNYRSRGDSSPRKKRTLLSLAWFQKYFRNLDRKKLWTLAFRGAAVFIVFLALTFIYYSKDLPEPGQLVARNIPESTKIFSRDGDLLYEIHGEVKRTQVALDQISDDAEHATIAIEDKDFYNHNGISFTGIARSIIVDITKGEKAQGGSTITQQFVKWAILSRDKSFVRKFKELILAIEIEARFSKEQILNFYLNEIPYGRNAYGIQAASQAYFNKPASELTLAQSAYLAALPQAPSYYNPLGPNRDALNGRQRRVLEVMKEQGYIDQARFDEAIKEEVTFEKPRDAITAPHFVLFVQDYLAQKYGEKTIQEGGLKVYTTLDKRLQEIAETAVREGADRNVKNSGSYNAALVAQDPKTGQILAMVGSKDYFGQSEPAGCTAGVDCKFDPNVNVAVASRQPGSSFKPYVYSTAFKKDYGYSPASPLVDVITNFGDDGSGKAYVPKNYDGGQHGPVSIRQALAGSLNIPAVKMLALVGVDNATQTARDMGITSRLQNCGLALVLGGCEVKLIDHVAAFSTLATLGERHQQTSIMKIEDRQGKVLEEYKDETNQVLDPQAAYLTVDIMKDNTARSYIFGGNSSLNISGREVAAKSGTANEWRDQWTLGFTPSLVAGVWSGNNDRSRPKQSSASDGSQTAAPIWNRFMREALKDQPNETFKQPEGIQKVTVDSLSGKLPTELSTETRTEVFASYNVPKNFDDTHVAIRIDNLTGLPADSSTPSDQISYKFYTILHSEKRDNPNWENPVVAWALANGWEYPPSGAQYTSGGDIDPGQISTGGPNIEITEPNNNQVITSVPFSVSVTSTDPDKILRLELSIDGELKQSASTAPHTFNVKEKMPDGFHTIGIKAVGVDGKVSARSVPVLYSLSQSLAIINPDAGDTLNFPSTLRARSSQQYDTVYFYYQIGGNSTLINGTAPELAGGQYQYSISWDNAPSSGKYQIFARSDSGDTSQKITVTVP